MTDNAMISPAATRSKKQMMWIVGAAGLGGCSLAVALKMLVAIGIGGAALAELARVLPPPLGFLAGAVLACSVFVIKGLVKRRS
jgi:hypothetical protein